MMSEQYQPYTVHTNETSAVIYKFGEKVKEYNIIEYAYADCARLNKEFSRQAESLYDAFCAYMNAPRGWVWEARMEKAIQAFMERNSRE